MADLTFTLTTAGLAALVNPANTGTSAITVASIGISSVVLPGAPASNVGLTALPAELKRLVTFGGDVVGDNVVHVTVRDESADVYQLRTFGLYSAGGLLLAFYTQPTAIMEKAAASLLLLAADLQFTTPIAAELVFGDTTFTNPPATTTQAGVVELSTKEEAATGTDALRAVTPFGLKWVLDQLLPNKANVAHTHAAADVVSGVFAIARIPDLALAKITGLVDALAGKAAAAHTHAQSEIIGLISALGLKLSIADFTWQNLVGKPNVAVLSQDATFGGLSVNSLSVAGFGPWTSGNFNPDAKLDVSSFNWPTLAGKPATFPPSPHTHPWADVTGKPATFPPSAHTHPWTEVGDKPASFPPSAHTHPWSEVTGKPFVAVQGTDVQFTRVTLDAGSEPSILYFGPLLNRYLFYNGADFYVGGGTSAFRASGKIFTADQEVWSPHNFNPGTKATLNQDVTFRDVRADRGDGSGVLYLAGAARRLQYASGVYQFVDADLQIMGHTAWHDGNGLDRAWPAGEIRYLATTTIPAGMRALRANGAAVSRATYARLFAAIGTTFGEGDGATTFNLPDERGVFIRGLDEGRGIDPGRELFALQTSQNLAHAHSIPSRSNDGSNNGYLEDANADGLVRTVLTSTEGGSEARPTNNARLAVITY